MPDDRRELIMRFCIATNIIDECYWRLSHDTAYSNSEVCLLYALNDGKLHSQKEISENWCLPKTTLNSAAKKLEAGGFIELKKIEDKKREKEIVLTESGKALAEKLLKDMYQAESFAMGETIEKYPDFVDAIEYWSTLFKTKIDDIKKEEKSNE